MVDMMAIVVMLNQLVDQAPALVFRTHTVVIAVFINHDYVLMVVEDVG